MNGELCIPEISRSYQGEQVTISATTADTCQGRNALPPQCSIWTQEQGCPQSSSLSWTKQLSLLDWTCSQHSNPSTLQISHQSWEIQKSILDYHPQIKQIINLRWIYKQILLDKKQNDCIVRWYYRNQTYKR